MKRTGRLRLAWLALDLMLVGCLWLAIFEVWRTIAIKPCEPCTVTLACSCSDVSKDLQRCASMLTDCIVDLDLVKTECAIP